MTVIYEGRAWVSYGQIHVLPRVEVEPVEPEPPPPEAGAPDDGERDRRPDGVTDTSVPVDTDARNVLAWIREPVADPLAGHDPGRFESDDEPDQLTLFAESLPLVDVEAELARLRASAVDPDLVLFVTDGHGGEARELGAVFEVIRPGYVFGSRPDLEETLEQLIRDWRLGGRMNDEAILRLEAEDLEDQDQEDQEEDDPEDHLATAFTDQRNGICGAAIRHRLALITGLHTGEVMMRVEVLEAEPVLDPVWEDVVEVSFRPSPTGATLVALEEEEVCTLPLTPVDHRVRYCARGMDAAHQEGDDLEDDAEPLDSYLLQLWPASPGPDVVVRQGSEHAAYCHTAWAEPQ